MFFPPLTLYILGQFCTIYDVECVALPPISYDVHYTALNAFLFRVILYDVES